MAPGPPAECRCSNRGGEAPSVIDDGPGFLLRGSYLAARARRRGCGEKELFEFVDNAVIFKKHISTGSDTGGDVGTPFSVIGQTDGNAHIVVAVGSDAIQESHAAIASVGDAAAQEPSGQCHHGTTDRE